MPDVGASASVSGLGYLGSGAYSHSLEYFLSGYLNYQDLVGISFLFNQVFTVPLRNSGPYGTKTRTLEEKFYTPAVKFRYGPVGVGLGYSTRDSDLLGDSDILAGIFSLNFDWLEIDMGVAWSGYVDMQIWQFTPRFTYRPTDGLAISLLGGWEASELNDLQGWENIFSLEGQLQLQVTDGLVMNISAWGGKRVQWVDQQMMTSLNLADLYRFGFEGGLGWTVSEHVIFSVGLFGQFGTQENNDDVKVGYLGGYLGLLTHF